MTKYILFVTVILFIGCATEPKSGTPVSQSGYLGTWHDSEADTLTFVSETSCTFSQRGAIIAPTVSNTGDTAFVLAWATDDNQCTLYLACSHDSLNGYESIRWGNGLGSSVPVAFIR